ncbi:MAG: hypothetical protein JW395_3706 [Nitrospira sp.]|nr:hypothetical protein [Nitrospira sp.]
MSIPELKEGFYHREEKTVGYVDPTVIVVWKLYGTDRDGNRGGAYLELTECQKVYTGFLINEASKSSPIADSVAQNMHEWLEMLWARSQKSLEELAAEAAYADQQDAEDAARV